MAHPNIDGRRARVRALLDAGQQINGTIRRELAQEFNCTASAIKADVLALTLQTTATIHIAAGMRRKIYARDGRICQYCGTTEATCYIIEHVLPAAQGGVARPYNLTVACQVCNTRKRGKAWFPRNWEAMTEGHPEWRVKVEEIAQGIRKALEAIG